MLSTSIKIYKNLLLLKLNLSTRLKQQQNAFYFSSKDMRNNQQDKHQQSFAANKSQKDNRALITKIKACYLIEHVQEIYKHVIKEQKQNVSALVNILTCIFKRRWSINKHIDMVKHCYHFFYKNLMEHPQKIDDNLFVLFLESGILADYNAKRIIKSDEKEKVVQEGWQRFQQFSLENRAKFIFNIVHLKIQYPPVKGKIIENQGFLQKATELNNEDKKIFYKKQLNGLAAYYNAIHLIKTQQISISYKTDMLNIIVSGIDLISVKTISHCLQFAKEKDKILSESRYILYLLKILKCISDSSKITNQLLEKGYSKGVVSFRNVVQLITIVDQIKIYRKIGKNIEKQGLNSEELKLVGQEKYIVQKVLQMFQAYLLESAIKKEKEKSQMNTEIKGYRKQLIAERALTVKQSQDSEEDVENVEEEKYLPNISLLELTRIFKKMIEMRYFPTEIIKIFKSTFFMKMPRSKSKDIQYFIIEINKLFKLLVDNINQGQGKQKTKDRDQKRNKQAENSSQQQSSRHQMKEKDQKEQKQKVNDQQSNNVIKQSQKSRDEEMHGGYEKDSSETKRTTRLNKIKQFDIICMNNRHEEIQFLNRLILELHMHRLHFKAEEVIEIVKKFSFLNLKSRALKKNLTTLYQFYIDQIKNEIKKPQDRNSNVNTTEEMKEKMVNVMEDQIRSFSRS